MQIMVRFFDKFFHHATAMAWASWREYVFAAETAIERAASAEIEASNRHVTVRRVVYRLAKRQEARCFRAWDQFRYAMAKHEMDLAKAEAEQLQTAHAKGDSLHRLVARSASRFKRRRFNLWVRAAHSMQRAADATKQRHRAAERLIKRMKTRSLMLAMQLWLEGCDEVMRAIEELSLIHI